MSNESFFDRSTPYCDTNPKALYPSKERKGISIAIRTGLKEMENIHIIETMEHYFGHLKIHPVDRLSVRGVETPSDLNNNVEALKSAYENVIIFYHFAGINLQCD